MYCTYVNIVYSKCFFEKYLYPIFKKKKKKDIVLLRLVSYMYICIFVPYFILYKKLI